MVWRVKQPRRWWQVKKESMKNEFALYEILPSLFSLLNLFVAENLDGEFSRSLFVTKFKKRKKNSSFCVHIPHKTPH